MKFSVLFNIMFFTFDLFSRWVREFLDDQNQGLDSLIDYLSFRLVMMRHEQRQTESRANSEERINSRKLMFLLFEFLSKQVDCK